MTAFFEQDLARHRDLTVGGLFSALGITEDAVPKLPFDPEKARYYPEIRRELQLSRDEQRVFKRHGFVIVDHDQPTSMGSVYFNIYARDLPVLVTTDSILHALHRSYESILEGLESSLFARTLDRVIAKTHGKLSELGGPSLDPALLASSRDADLYLTVARNLLAGGGAAAAGRKPRSPGRHAPPPTFVASLLGQDAAAKRLLANISSLELQVPPQCTELYGSSRAIDFSQFKPRGHYTRSEALSRYFRALMWLGRADTGWRLAETAGEIQGCAKADTERERRSAALLSLLMARSGTLDSFEAMGHMIDFMVGSADTVSVASMIRALARAQVTSPEQLASSATLEAVMAALAAEVSMAQQIRSEVVLSERGKGPEAPLPERFQLFGQRFVLDSYVLSKVVFDSIVFKGIQQERMMPSGLDVMAAFGNDEAVKILRPELDRFNYSANLLSARRLVESRSESDWAESAYAMWLDALRRVDDASTGPNFPSAMKSPAWSRKQLSTALASWAELRHDTLLYAKQSYTGFPLCEYPDGYVEPYPAFYRRVGELMTVLGKQLSAFKPTEDDPQQLASLNRMCEYFLRTLQSFASVMSQLETLADKELRAQPFTEEERDFLKKTIDERGGGSGPPTYTGWYPLLITGRTPVEYAPTIADVHTDPDSGAVLEEGTGPVNYVVVAVDNQQHRTVYVGPVSSYYEFTAPASARMTDEEWMGKLAADPKPEAPGWTRAFRPPAVNRTLGEVGDGSPKGGLTPRAKEELAGLREALKRPRGTPPEWEDRARARIRALEKLEQAK